MIARIDFVAMASGGSAVMRDKRFMRAEPWTLLRINHRLTESTTTRGTPVAAVSQLLLDR